LLGQGGLVLALALNYLYQDTLALPNVVFTTAVISVLLTDLASGRLASSVLDAFTTRMAEGRAERAAIGATALGTASRTRDASPDAAASEHIKEPS
jgi:hypothetical protein